jgi:uncharacterized membrane protein
LLKGKNTYKEVIIIKNKKYIWFVIFAGFVTFVWILCNITTVAEGWDIAIIYKIISYSLFFPIIFSIIYYKEKVTWKKLLAFALTIVSILLFV